MDFEQKLSNFVTSLNSGLLNKDVASDKHEMLCNQLSNTYVYDCKCFNDALATLMECLDVINKL